MDFFLWMLEVENLHILHQSNEILHIFVELFIYIMIISTEWLALPRQKKRHAKSTIHQFCILLFGLEQVQLSVSSQVKHIACGNVSSCWLHLTLSVSLVVNHLILSVYCARRVLKMMLNHLQIAWVLILWKPRIFSQLNFNVNLYIEFTKNILWYILRKFCEIWIKVSNWKSC